MYKVALFRMDLCANLLYTRKCFVRYFLKSCKVVLYKDYDEKICEAIIWTIQQNDFVVITLDEYFLHNKQNYHLRHSFHEILCYGYDESKEIIYALTHNERGIFAFLSLKYEVGI